MKCSEAWLREWVNPKLSREELCHVLTMAGLEVEDLLPVATPFSNVLVGEVTKLEKHPEADRLNVCEVDVGAPQKLQIVCGAANVRLHMKAAVAMIGAVLPNGSNIKAASLRGVASAGMLASAMELGLSEQSEGLLVLPESAPIGKSVWDYLQLADYVIDVSITPNRGDCLSIKGMSREVAALTQAPLHEHLINDVKAGIAERPAITIQQPVECPRYVGRIIRGVNAGAEIPVWLKERLRRSGIRSINPIVDVTNYVMLELGQPMHAFDLEKTGLSIIVRHSKQGEKITLLDGSEKILDNQTLVIADEKKPLAIAGVMGGHDSSVTLITTDILLESAWFSPKAVAQSRQYYQLSSDSAYRFERGVDPQLQRQAMERATQLILEIAGGKAGEVIEQTSQKDLPVMSVISLPEDKITRLLGIDIPEKEIETILTRLQFGWKKEKKVYLINVPLYRSDITLPEDIIEEIARLYGYDRIPTHTATAVLHVMDDDPSDLSAWRQALADLGYYEIISYSFVDKNHQAVLNPDVVSHALINPMTAEMDVMRTNLWPGLLTTLHYNKSRQQGRVRLFEIGTTFITDRQGKLEQPMRLGGLITGLLLPEQWGAPARDADFYDVKGDIENILKRACPGNNFNFQVVNNKVLHPGQSAAIYQGEQAIGIMGLLHPTAAQALDVQGKVFLFEISLDVLKKATLTHIQDVSRFPEIRRDLAILVNQAIPSKQIQDTIKLVAGDWLKDVFVFDVYQGKGIAPDAKSVAVALVLQHPSRTLVDEEVTALLGKVVNGLKEQLGAELRS